MSFNHDDIKQEVLYQRSNQVLFRLEVPNIVDGGFDTTTDIIYMLYSYKTLVLEIVNGEQVVNAKTGLNYDGHRSVTTSKHITQALSYIYNQ